MPPHTFILYLLQTLHKLHLLSWKRVHKHLDYPCRGLYKKLSYDDMVSISDAFLLGFTWTPHEGRGRDDDNDDDYDESLASDSCMVDLVAKEHRKCLAAFNLIN